MRIAAIQLEVDPRRRAATLQAALGAVDCAAESEPAPDLVLLPAFVDVPALAAGLPAIKERLSGSLIAAFGLRARQWGIFIALGFVEAGPRGKAWLSTVLLDRDGDVVGHHRARSVGKQFGACVEAGERFTCVGGLLGCLALMGGDDPLETAAWDAAATACARVVLVSSGWGGLVRANHAPEDTATHAARMARVVSEARRVGRAAAVADVSIAGIAGIEPGMVFDAGGRRGAETPIGAGRMCWLDLADAPDGSAR